MNYLTDLYGLKQDKKVAVKWLKKSAVQGNARAQYTLANHLMSGLQDFYEPPASAYSKLEPNIVPNPYDYTFYLIQKNHI